MSERFERDGSGPHVDERICDWVDGRLSPRDLERFEAELRVNKQLRAQADEYKRSVLAVRQALTSDGPPIDITGRVLAAIAGGARLQPQAPARPQVATGRPRWWALAASGIVATAALALFSVLIEWQSNTPLRQDVANAPVVGHATGGSEVGGGETGSREIGSGANGAAKDDRYKDRETAADGGFASEAPRAAKAVPEHENVAPLLAVPPAPSADDLTRAEALRRSVGEVADGAKLQQAEPGAVPPPSAARSSEAAGAPRGADEFFLAERNKQKAAPPEGAPAGGKPAEQAREQAAERKSADAKPDAPGADKSADKSADAKPASTDPAAIADGLTASRTAPTLDTPRSQALGGESKDKIAAEKDEAAKALAAKDSEELRKEGTSRFGSGDGSRPTPAQTALAAARAVVPQVQLRRAPETDDKKRAERERLDADRAPLDVAKLAGTLSAQKLGGVPTTAGEASKAELPPITDGVAWLIDGTPQEISAFLARLGAAARAQGFEVQNGEADENSVLALVPVAPSAPPVDRGAAGEKGGANTPATGGAAKGGAVPETARGMTRGAPAAGTTGGPGGAPLPRMRLVVVLPGAAVPAPKPDVPGGGR